MKCNTIYFIGYNSNQAMLNKQYTGAITEQDVKDLLEDMRKNEPVCYILPYKLSEEINKHLAEKINGYG